MKFRVAFMERTNAGGESTEEPSEYVELDLADGVVLDCSFVGRTKPDALHVEESLEEDDSFESIGTETWEYDIAEGREQEFIDALKNSRMAIDYEELDNLDMIEPGELAPSSAGAALQAKCDTRCEARPQAAEVKNCNRCTSIEHHPRQDG
jgi:hypothetical protein